MSSPNIRLQVLGQGGQGTSWQSSRTLRVGRAPFLEISLPDASLSRRHAEIRFVDRHGWIVRDLGSTNGTFLNGIRVDPTERRLEARDILQFGNLVFLVTDLEGDVPSAVLEPILDPPIPAGVSRSWEETLEILGLEVARCAQPSLEEQFREWSRLSPEDQASAATQCIPRTAPKSRDPRGSDPVLLGKSSTA